MKKITTTQEVTFVALLVLILSVAGYVLLYRHIDVLRAKLSDAKVEIANVENYEASKQAIVILLDETKQGREELSRYFVPLGDPTPFLELIESIAKDSGVVLEVETLAELPSEKEDENSKKVKAVLLVEGEWKNVYHFISLVELLPFVVTVTQAAFTIDEKDDSTLWKGQIHLEYYAK